MVAKLIDRVFLEHCHAANETYMEHLVFTLKMGSRFFYCWAVIMVHGIVPCLFTRTASTQMEKMYKIMKGRAMAVPLHNIEVTNYQI